MDLYQPLYIQRPEVQLELYQSLVPKTNQMAMEAAAPEEDEAMAEAAPPAPAPSAAAKSSAPRALLGAASAAVPPGGISPCPRA